MRSSATKQWFQQLAQKKKKKKASASVSINRQLLDSHFPMLMASAKRVIATFGSAYSCGEQFSKMKFSKSKLRSQLTHDQHPVLNSS